MEQQTSGSQNNKATMVMVAILAGFKPVVVAGRRTSAHS